MQENVVVANIRICSFSIQSKPCELSAGEEARTLPRSGKLSVPSMRLASAPSSATKKRRAAWVVGETKCKACLSTKRFRARLANSHEWSHATALWRARKILLKFRSRRRAHWQLTERSTKATVRILALSMMTRGGQPSAATARSACAPLMALPLANGNWKVYYFQASPISL